MKQKSERNNLILVVIFGLCVLFLIIGSLMIKMWGVVKESRFDGDHRFTVLLSDSAHNVVYLTVDPSQEKRGKLVVSNASVEQALSQLPVGVDGLIVLSAEFDPEDSIPSLIQTALIKRNEVRTNITFLDLIRIYIAAKTGTDEEIDENISLQFSNPELFRELFLDKKLQDDDLTIAIENASATSGVGTRLEEILTTLGANVISVETAVTKSKHSKIVFFEEESYTSRKLETLLGYPLEMSSSIAVADISIIIGEDGLDTIVFQSVHTQ